MLVHLAHGEALRTNRSLRLKNVDLLARKLPTPRTGTRKAQVESENYSCGISVSRIKERFCGGWILRISKVRNAKAVMFRIVTNSAGEYIFWPSWKG